MSFLPRCETLPLDGRQCSFRVDDREITRWHFADQEPRPCFYPLLGPQSGKSLTRMGHPGAPNHDHHRSVWFAHQKLLGIDFWSEGTPARIRQQQWLVYEDGPDAAGMAVQLGWFDGHEPQPLIEQELIAFVRPQNGNEYVLDLQSTFRPRADQIEFQQTNFGFLAVRVAKSLSAHFGGGQITSSEGQTGEQQVFARRARWVDYSGPMPLYGHDGQQATVVEGITYIDHPSNPGYPNPWHVRDDGWMGCAPCLSGPLTTSRAVPLVLRYLLHIHRGPADAARTDALADEWARRPACRVVRSRLPHQQFIIERGSDPISNSD